MESTATPAPPLSWRAAVLLALFTWALLGLLAHAGVFAAGNDASRFAQIEALVDQGVPYIEHTRYRWTVDQVHLHGHSYSNKPPILAWVGAGLYWGIKHVTGWTFAHDSLRVTWLLTWLLAGLPTAVLVGVFARALALHGALPRRTQVLAVLGLAAGTILTSYSTTLNNHSNAAAFLFFAFYCAWQRQFVWAGIWAGVTTWIDVLPGLLFIPVLLWLAWAAGGWRPLARIVVPLSAGALVMFAVDYATVGSWLLPKLVPGAVDQSAAFGQNVGGVLLPERWSYPLECLFAGHGLLSVSPVLCFALAGLVVAVRRARGTARTGLLALSAALAVFVVGHLCLAGSYGGWSYGFRYVIPVIPLLCFFIPLALPGRWAQVYVPVLVVSVLFTLLGATHPWPPAYEQAANADPVAGVVTNPVGGNAAAWLAAHAPGTPLATWAAATFISPDPALQQQYLDLFRQSRGIP